MFYKFKLGFHLEMMLVSSHGQSFVYPVFGKIIYDFPRERKRIVFNTQVKSAFISICAKRSTRAVLVSSVVLCLNDVAAYSQLQLELLDSERDIALVSN